MTVQVIEGLLKGSAWEEVDVFARDEAVKVTEVKEKWEFSGDGVSGQGDVVYVMAYRETGIVDFVGFEMLEMTVHGLSGTLFLRSEGVFEQGTATCKWTVQPDMSTGDFKGATGSGGYAAHGHDPVAFKLELSI